MTNPHNVTYESVFQADIVTQMQAHGWQLGNSSGYQPETALYEQDVLDFVQSTQLEEWEKFCRTHPIDSERHFITALVKQLNKADENATDKASRTYGTLGVLRHDLKIRNARFSLCQFKPEHNLNPETMARYKANICRIVPEVVYSPHTSIKDSPKGETDGKVAKRNRIDIVLFVNGLPVTTMELKSEFKQSVDNAISQYKKTRLPKDPDTGKPEPLLTFKRGALVHFAVSQYEVYMTTRLAGENTYFLPFNKGTASGGAGNDVPADSSRYATDYLWNDVLTPDNLLAILGHFMHLQIEEEEDVIGLKSKRETMMFPRYHQWDVVTKLVNAAISEGAGHSSEQHSDRQRYLIQHSAGSGKSNSIAWTAHQLSTLYNEQGDKQFHSVIVITDRTILDDQLQDTIYQFEHADGVVGKINRNEGDGSKSEQLASALVNAQPIIIVTIQTFPFVLKAIEDSSVLKSRRYAIIADEAHSSQTGSTARQLKEVLVSGEIKKSEDSALSDEDVINQTMEANLAARRSSPNLSYYAFTATPKPKTIELFGRRPNPDLPASKQNKPESYHVYSMRQAIEEGFILDVLKNYTNYKVVYQLKQTLKADDEVDSRRAKIKLNNWVRLHDHNIAQKVKVIIEHFNDNVKGLLGGQAKAMVVTSSRKEAVRYKIAFDNYIADNGYRGINAMVAFSGEVTFDAHDLENSSDTDSSGLVPDLVGEKFTEHSMNIGLKGRDLRTAFDSASFGHEEYQVMLVANKFQTGFDQPKLCAMYVDKKLVGVDCVQTLSRLNRTYKGKAESGTFVLDFFNDPDDILAAFQPYYETATLADVSDPDQVYDLYNKLDSSNIFTKNEVEQFVKAFYSKNKSNAAISNICKPAVERWQKQYLEARTEAKHAKTMLEETKTTGNVVLITNAENDYKGFKAKQDELEIFKKDLGTFTRQYEFMSQIVDYDSKDLEKLSLYARNLQPLLRESASDDDDIDLSNIVMSHYRVSKLYQQDLKLQESQSEYQLDAGGGAGTAKPKDKKEERLSQIITRLNEIFSTENLTDKDMLNYAHTVSDKMSEDDLVMKQIANNAKAQAMLGGFSKSLDDAIMSSSAAHEEQMMQLLSDPIKTQKFAQVVYDLLCA